MNFTEVKREYEQGNSGFHVVPLAAESVGQPRESAHPHSDSQVCSFNVGRANQIAVGIAEKPVNNNLSQPVKENNKWDLLINEAKDRVQELQRAIEHFERNKAKGEPYFGEQGVTIQPSSGAH